MIALITFLNAGKVLWLSEKNIDKITGEPMECPDFRTVALVTAIERVANATLIRGIWP